MFGKETTDMNSMTLGLQSDIVHDVIQALLNKNVIGEKALNYLKHDEMKIFEPTMIMDLRHEQIKQEHKQCQGKHQILEEARRLLQSEEQAEKERVKELRLVNREIQKFQKQLEMEHRKLINDYNFHRISAKKLWTVNGDNNSSPVIAVTAMRQRTSSNQDLKHSDFYPNELFDVKTLEIQEIHHKEFECEEGNQNFIEVLIKKAERSNSMDQNKLEVSDEMQKPEALWNEGQNSESNVAECKAENEYKIMNRVWIKWMKFVQRRRVVLKEELEETDTASQMITCIKQTENILGAEKTEPNYLVCSDAFNSDCDEDCDNHANEYFFEQFQNQKNKLIMRKYFKAWRKWVLEQSELKHLKAEKQRRAEKIKKYIELVGTKKKCAIEAKSKSSTSLEESSSTGASDLSDNCSKVSKISSPSSSYGEKYKYRFEAQKNIIALQKSKIEDQSKVIEDLKSFQMKLEAEMSQRETSKNLKATLQNFDLRLRSKAAFVQRALSSDSGYKSFEQMSEENSETQDFDEPYSKPKSVSQEIVRRMEKRNEERKKKWEAAQERRRRFEEEKFRKIKEEEEMKQQREFEAKQRKFEELREKQRLEKRREEERIREREIYEQNCQIAEESNRRRLLAKGLRRLRYNVLVIKRDTFIADDHYRMKLRQKYFCAWQRNARQTVVAKIDKAVHFYNHRLIQRAFLRFFEIYKDYIQKLQAADDMYDMKIQSKCFKRWYDITCMAYLEMQDKMKIAVNFHNRRIVRGHFNQWKKLPKIMFQERSREQRLRALRERVQELLPDYHPVPFDDED